MSSDLSLNRINYQNQLRSKPIRENFTDIENNFNALRTEVYASIASTASEITSARDNFGNLSDNIHSRKIYGAFWVTGGIVSSQATADNTIRVTAGEGIVNGEGVDWSSATSATISAPSTGRFDVVVINTDNSLSIIKGNDAAHKVLPNLTDTQRPLSLITQDTASPLTITASDITDIRLQGAFARNKYFFKIQDAIDYIPTSGGKVKVNPGKYYEDLTLKENLQLEFEYGASIYNTTGSLIDYRDIDTSSYSVIKISSAGGEVVQSINTDNIFLKQKLVEIGDWNMDNNASKSIVVSNFDNTKVRHVSVMIRNDSNLTYTPLNNYNSVDDLSGGGIDNISQDGANTLIALVRRLNGYFDSVNYDSTSYNRGYIIITYQAY